MKCFLSFLLILGFSATLCFSQDQDSKTIFLFAPMAGIAKIDVDYSVPNSSVKQNLNDSGPLYGMHMLFINPKFVVGTLGHYTELGKGKENGYLVTGDYFFREKEKWQPMLGASVEYIHTLTELGLSDVAPLDALNVDSSIWAFYPIAGISYKNEHFRISPYAGYFKETVETIVMSDGMRVGGQLKYGFRVKSHADLDYFSIGTKFEFTLGHFMRYDGKFYVRLRSGEEDHLTTRNRLDFFLSRNVAISAKIDYFQDQFETTTMYLFGPAIVF
jgi:hypothetical protein